MKRFNLNLLTILAVMLSLSVMTTSCSDDDEGGTAAIEDLDGDGVADSDDPDIDGDDVANEDDQEPNNPDVGAGDDGVGTDTDSDGIADSEDDDIDGDGLPNGQDDDPTDPDIGNAFATQADTWTTSVEEGQQTTGANVSVFGWSYTASQIADDINGLEDESVSTDIAKKDDVSVSGFLTEDQTWTNDRFYILDGKTYVQEDVTLTIEPGTIIKGSASTGANASALIVSQGGTLIANGTAEKPIIFTAEADNIKLGETAGTNLGINDRQLWGGLLVLGKARGSFSGDAVAIQVEGLPASEPGAYGGSNNQDNSGILNYVSVRHGGAVIGSDNEINGITLGAVGSETQISNLEIVANADDGLEIFGGTVDVSNVIVWGCEDDQFDLDEAYSGTLSNIASIQVNDSDHAIESDGPAGSFEAAYTIDGMTMFGDNSADDGNTGNREYIDFREGNLATIKNVYAFGFPKGADVELDEDDTTPDGTLVAESQDALNYNEGLIKFENWQVVYPEGDDNFVMWNNTSESVVIE